MAVLRIGLAGACACVPAAGALFCTCPAFAEGSLAIKAASAGCPGRFACQAGGKQKPI